VVGRLREQWRRLPSDATNHSTETTPIALLAAQSLLENPKFQMLWGLVGSLIFIAVAVYVGVHVKRYFQEEAEIETFANAHGFTFAKNAAVMVTGTIDGLAFSLGTRSSGKKDTHVGLQDSRPSDRRSYKKVMKLAIPYPPERFTARANTKINRMLLGRVHSGTLVETGDAAFDDKVVTYGMNADEVLAYLTAGRKAALARFLEEERAAVDETGLSLSWSKGYKSAQDLDGMLQTLTVAAAELR
jgi:hypothetical protein